MESPDNAHDAALLGEVADAIEAGRVSIVRTFKADSRSTVQLIEHAGRRYVLKQYHQGGWKTTLYHLFRATPAWREARAAKAVAAAGVRGSVPLLLRHVGRSGQAYQLLLLPHVEGRSLYRVLFDDPPPGQWSAEHRVRRRRMARWIGRQMGRLLEAGAINRDHKPSNLIVDPACEAGEAEPVLIDPLGVRPWRGNIGPVVAMVLTMARASYQAGGATKRERLTCLIAMFRGEGMMDAEQRAWAKRIMHEVDRRLGEVPEKDRDRRGG